MSTRKRPQKTTPKAKALTFEKSEDHEARYSNVVQVLHTPYDFQLTFGFIEAVIQGTGIPRVSAVATVLLSPQHAKQLSDVLSKNVAKYEEKVMKLPLGLVKIGSVDEEGEIEIVMADNKPAS